MRPPAFRLGRILPPTAALIACGLLARPSHSQGGGPPAPSEGHASPRSPALRSAVDTLADKVHKLGGIVGVAIVDVGSGELLAAHQEHKAFNPASNEKVLTAAAVLSEMRPSFRYQTALYGTQKGSTASGLVLRGTGDPSLSTRDLWDMVHDLREAGVRKVDGDIQVDQRFFDDQFVPPAFEQQPNEWSAFRAPVSALALDENTVTLTVRPTTKGSAAVASFEPPGFVDIDGQVKTVEEGAAENVVLTLQPAGTRLAAKLSGTIPADSKVLRFTKRVDNPALLAGYALKALLVQNGITVAGEVKAGGESKAKTALSEHLSRPLSTLLYELGKQSDNFYAEMTFKSLALDRKGKPAKAANAAEVVTQFLNDQGAFEEGDVVKNGSGLFDADRVTPSTFVKVLRAAYRDPAYSGEFLAQLSVGGVDGTLRHRFREGKGRGVVRAKTGTLENTAALSGYVMPPAGKSPVAFSILVNNVAGKVGDARPAIDDCVDAIVDALWK